jgi:hypothetical protein
MNGFLDEDYKPDASTGQYMKFEQGANRFRILERPITGYEWWVHEDGSIVERGEKPIKGNKPVRMPKNKKHPLYKALDMEQYEASKEFWAMVVWNYNAKQIQILSITQSSIIQTLFALVRNPEWGSPLEYDLTVSRDGEGLQTTYEVIPLPPKELSMDIRKALMSTKINIEALFTGDDPFTKEGLTEEDEDDIDEALNNKMAGNEEFPIPA